MAVGGSYISRLLSVVGCFHAFQPNSRSEVLVERRVFVVELNLNLVDFEEAVPLRLVPETVGERTLGVLLGDEELYRFRVVKFGERVQAHGTGRLSQAGLRYPLLVRAATASKRWRFLFRSSSRAAYDAYCPGQRADTLLRPLPRGKVSAPPGQQPD